MIKNRKRKAQNTIPCGTKIDQCGWEAVRLSRKRQIRATAVRHLGRHAYALAQRGVRVYGFADVHRVGAHLYGQRNFAQHVARVGADDAAALDLAVAMSFRAVVKQELGKALGAAVGGGAARGGAGKEALFDLDALRLGLGFGQAQPGDFLVACTKKRI